MPLISVVIPTLGRYQILNDTLNDLAGQSIKDFEVLVIDQTKKEEAAPVDHEALTVKYFWLPAPSASGARNVGIKHAAADIVLFLDDDVQIRNPAFLASHLAHYTSKEYCGVAGAILSPGEGFRDTRHRLSYKKNWGWLFFPINYSQPIPVPNGWAGNLSVRTHLARAIGGMDEQFEKGAFREESDFCLRLTKQYGPLMYEPAACLIHLGAASGGLRTWKTASNVKSQQHFDGFFYFLFKNIRLQHYPPHLMTFYIIFFHKKGFLARPKQLFTALGRTFKGFFHAVAKRKQGPLYLEKPPVTK
jgi:GT2 family glycosyltransferase